MTLVSLGEHDDKRNKSWAPVGEEIVLAALERIVDSVHYPVLITCNTGKHRTGEKRMLPSWYTCGSACSLPQVLVWFADL